MSDYVPNWLPTDVQIVNGYPNYTKTTTDNRWIDFGSKSNQIPIGSWCLIIHIIGFVEQSNSEDCEIKFPYSTYTISRSDKDNKKEPGRHNMKNCANLRNIQKVMEFVNKNNLDIEATWDEKQKELWKAALLKDYGEPAFVQAEQDHHSPFRLIEGIAGFCTTAIKWGVALNNFAYKQSDDIINELEILCANQKSFVMQHDGNLPSSCQANIASFTIKNTLGQKVSNEVSGTNGILVNASAGHSGNIDGGGGCFGEPCFAKSTQEEDFFHRFFSFSMQIFVQFCLGSYVETTTKKIVDIEGNKIEVYEKVSRFMYKTNYAPENGRVLAIPIGKGNYAFLSAAYNCSKKNYTPKEQLDLHTKVLSCLINFAIKNNIKTLILGAFGIGVFKGKVECLAEAMSNVRNDFHDPQSSNRLDCVIAYLVRKNDTTAISNYNHLAKMLKCPQCETA